MNIVSNRLDRECADLSQQTTRELFLTAFEAPRRKLKVKARKRLKATISDQATKLDWGLAAIQALSRKVTENDESSASRPELAEDMELELKIINYLLKTIATGNLKVSFFYRGGRVRSMDNINNLYGEPGPYVMGRIRANGKTSFSVICLQVSARDGLNNLDGGAYNILPLLLNLFAENILPLQDRDLHQRFRRRGWGRSYGVWQHVFDHVVAVRNRQTPNLPVDSQLNIA